MWNASSAFTTNGMSGLDMLEIVNLSIVAETSDYAGYGVSCNSENDGWIDITVLGGTGPYLYSWTHGSESEDLPAGLVAKTYTLTVTDINGCSVTQDIEIIFKFFNRFKKIVIKPIHGYGGNKILLIKVRFQNFKRK